MANEESLLVRVLGPFSPLTNERIGKLLKKDGEDEEISELRMDPPEELTEHVVDSIHPYVEQDLRDAVSVPLEVWLAAVYKLPKARLDSWTSKIGELKWFEDEVIERCLVEYCSADAEDKRYAPFVTLANRILSLARGALPGVRKSKSYPIDDICYMHNADRPVDRIPEHRGLGAKRKLDIVVTHGAAAEKLKKDKTIRWVDILQWWELKLGSGLIDTLHAERVSRGMKPLDKLSGAIIEARPDDNVENVRQVKETAKKPRASKNAKRSRPTAKASQSTSPAANTVKTSLKRSLEADLLAGIDLGSSSKRKDSENPNYDLAVGKQAAIQSGAYALEVLSCTYGTRSFCHGAVLKDEKVSLWYYDAAGIVYTKQYLSLVRDFEKVAAIIVGSACCAPEQFGAIPTSVMKPSIPHSKGFPPDNLRGSTLNVRHPTTGKRVRITLKDSLYTQYVLLGRRTFTYTMKAPSISKSELIAKFAYQVTTRRPEHELVTIACEAGVKHLPVIHMWADLWKMSEGTRRIFFGSDEQEKYEDRTLRMIVYARYSSIKDLFPKRCELIPIMVEQMIDCESTLNSLVDRRTHGREGLHDLRYKANMLHRDVSVNNIMYEMRDGRYCFILIDFDMAIALPKDGDAPYVPSSKHRTGTLPFMAYELVLNAATMATSSDWGPIKHLLRHDYQSLFWVSLWCILVLLTDELTSEQRNANLDEAKLWQARKLKLAAGRKEVLCTGSLYSQGIQLPPAAECLRRWLLNWTQLLDDANGAVKRHIRQVQIAALTHQPPPPFDEETVDGLITRDTLLATLRPVMPFKQIDRVTEEAAAQEASHGGNVDRLGGHAIEPTKPKRQTLRKILTKEQSTVRAGILSRLRPRKPVA
ncbi:hypothetical protein NM688_g1796 [Phlebia brevispora]|uniref:Uncharacterized protein n=1 Tax=Phlebia brevispora TaxID=194682 RepID=A0ACC1TAH5_9APHY|nr:hypothetical protein NM688_g1796 [Phlebia brevispora]